MTRISKINPNNLSWQNFRENANIKNLSTEEILIDLIKLEPNASFDEHSHKNAEWLYIVDGEYTDNFNTYYKGDFVVNKKGSSHVTKSGNDGCVVLVIKLANDRS
jgi:anti-sigma factor ChrR (cupin superfamily)